MTDIKSTPITSMKSQKLEKGDYKASRRFQQAQHAFAENGPVEKKAREAAEALGGPEKDDLERARKAAEEGEISK